MDFHATNGSASAPKFTPEERALLTAHAQELFPLAVRLAPRGPEKIKTPQSRAALLAFNLAEAFAFWRERFFAEDDRPAKAEASSEAASSGESPW